MEIKNIYNLMDKLDSSFLMNEESMILCEATRDEIYSVYYDENNGRSKRIPRFVFDSICDIDPTGSADRVGQFAKWIFNMWDTPRMKSHELEYVLGVPESFKYDANTFIKMKNMKSPHIEMDLNKYSLSEFSKKMKEARINGWDKSKKEQMDSNTVHIYEDYEWEVISPITYESEKKYGSGTGWCTAPNKSYFDSYTKNGNKLVILIHKTEPIEINGKRNPKRKYQIVVNNKGLISLGKRWESCDADDNYINYTETFPENIINVLKKYALTVEEEYIKLISERNKKYFNILSDVICKEYNINIDDVYFEKEDTIEGFNMIFFKVKGIDGYICYNETSKVFIKSPNSPYISNINVGGFNCLTNNIDDETISFEDINHEKYSILTTTWEVLKKYGLYWIDSTPVKINERYYILHKRKGGKLSTVYVWDESSQKMITELERDVKTYWLDSYFSTSRRVKMLKIKSSNGFYLCLDIEKMEYIHMNAGKDKKMEKFRNVLSLNDNTMAVSNGSERVYFIDRNTGESLFKKKNKPYPIQGFTMSYNDEIFRIYNSNEFFEKGYYHSSNLKKIEINKNKVIESIMVMKNIYFVKYFNKKLKKYETIMTYDIFSDKILPIKIMGNKDISPIKQYDTTLGLTFYVVRFGDKRQYSLLYNIDGGKLKIVNFNGIKIFDRITSYNAFISVSVGDDSYYLTSCKGGDENDFSIIKSKGPINYNDMYHYVYRSYVKFDSNLKKMFKVKKADYDKTLNSTFSSYPSSGSFYSL